jgi:hypothetical protein
MATQPTPALIAAAPAMLEVLKLLVSDADLLADDRPAQRPGCGPAPYLVKHDVVALARAALATAEGRGA